MRDWKKQSWLVVSALVLLVGCGGSAKPAPATPTSQEDKAVAPPELTPVPAPADLIAVLRLKSPGTLTDAIGGWINLPFDWRGKLRDVAGNVDSVVAFDAPVEAAAVLDPRASSRPSVLFAASIGLSSFDGALSFLRARGQSLERLPSGAYTVRLGEEVYCVVARALGTVPARLVCSNKERGLDALAPYLAQGLPKEELSKNQLHVELRAEPLRRRYGKNAQMLKLGVPFVLRELSVDNPRFDAAISDSAYALAEELIALADDVESLALDGVIDTSSDALDLSLSLKFRSQKSWIAESAAQAVHHVGSAPETFWALPQDATLASYQRSSNPEQSEKIAVAMGELAAGALDYAGLPGRLRDSAALALKQIFLTGGAYVYASGPGAEGGAVAATTDKKSKLAAVKAAFGYHLSAIDNDNGKLAELIRQWVAVYGDPAFIRTLKGKKVKVEILPSIKSRRVTAAQGLPAGSTVYELTLPSQAVAKWVDADVKDVTPMVFYAVVAQEGERAWIGISADEQFVYAKLRSALNPQQGATLMGREGIAKLRSMEAVGAGFLTLRHFLDQRGSFKSVSEGRSWASLSAQLQHRGEVPIVYRTTVSSDGREVSWTASAPRAVFEDVASAVVLLTGAD